MNYEKITNCTKLKNATILSKNNIHFCKRRIYSQDNLFCFISTAQMSNKSKY